MNAIEPLKDVRLISIRNSRPIIREHDFDIWIDASAPLHEIAISSEVA